MLRLAAALLVLAPLAACSGQRTLRMDPLAPSWIDDSSVSPRLVGDQFRKVMILPPSGTAGPDFQVSLAAAERAFIRRGVTVISPAITSRVVLTDGGQDQSDTGLRLSELERALVLARQSQSDAVLQIGSLTWTPAESSEHGRRYFVDSGRSDELVEVERSGWMQAREAERLAVTVDGEVLEFTGRLIDVDSGEVLVAFHTLVPRTHVGDPLVVVMEEGGKVKSATYRWQSDENAKTTRERAVSALFDRLSEVIARGESR